MQQMGCFSAFFQRVALWCGLHATSEVAEIAHVAPPVTAILLSAADSAQSQPLGASTSNPPRRLSEFVPAAVTRNAPPHRLLPPFRSSFVPRQRSSGPWITSWPSIDGVETRQVALQAGGARVGNQWALPYPSGISAPALPTTSHNMLVRAAGVGQHSRTRRLVLRADNHAQIATMLTVPATTRTQTSPPTASTPMYPPLRTAFAARPQRASSPSSLVESSSLRDSVDSWRDECGAESYAVDMRWHSAPILLPRGRCPMRCPMSWPNVVPPMSLRPSVLFSLSLMMGCF
jgi:hypothetical protein